ncbi:phage tail protein [Xenorhabdus khoisanae]|uniref:TipJ family phage tail tip protein n=2 Tax=Xenorhabdus khoisanae TaxID=880157 RepID=UPI002358F8BE|nr:phage tail protein [Xenorhabdus khoisanae]MDC9612295.1 phage tail protein [Xenorhabdus khoisanae]
MGHHLIQGSKGGSESPRTPVESPDSLQSTSYAKILLALGEGEFEGGLDGTNIFLDNTPIIGPDGQANFEGVKWEFRPGTPHQEYIPGMPAVENELTVGTELMESWVRSVTNTQLSAVRLRLSWPQLQKQEEDGDTVGYRIDYTIEVATDGGSYQELPTLAVDGKTTTKYERSHRIDLPKAHSGWQVRVRRLTPKQNTNRIADAMVVEAITEVIDAKLSYPETALLFVQFDAKQFRNIPQVSCEPKMRIIRVPDNYDPDSRAYSGVWQGAFKWAWTDNPAWVLYDLMMNDRFSIGTRVKAENLSLAKWDLYRIAQYCDQPVPDGKGGKEPRHTCNVYIQSQEDAWTVLRDIASIFRGMTFWANNNMNVLADMPRDMDYLYTRANVRDGKFVYASSSEKTHYSTAMVSWSDPQNGYQDAVEPVFDNRLIRRYDVKQADVTAIGCTRQSEAIRRGKWILHTNEYDRMVTFTVGLDGRIPLPGYVIGVADEMFSGRVLGGRVGAVNGRNITLDRVSSAKVGERLILNLPSGKAEGRTIQAVNGQVVTVTTDYSEMPATECVWAIDAADLAVQLFRVTGIKEGEDGVSFEITAVEHNPDKYTHIDTGTRIDERPISVIPPGVQPPPKKVTIGSYSVVNQGIAVNTLRVTWEAAESAIAYEAEWRRDNGNWIPAPRTSTQGFEVPNIYAGRYQARVRAINASEISSLWANAPETHLKGKQGNPPAPLAFRTTPIIFGIQLDWGFAPQTDDTLKTEIQYSPTNDGEGLMLLADIPYPQRTHTLQGLLAGVAFYFRARLVDKSGNQSPWTEFVRGESSTDTSWIVEATGNQFMTAEAGKRLQSQIDYQAEASLINGAAIQQNAHELLVRDGENKAEIKRLDRVFADEKEAWAQSIKEVKSSAGENRSSISENQKSINKLGSSFAESGKQVQAQLKNQQAMINTKMQAEFDQHSNGYAIHSVNITLKHNGKAYNAAGMVISGEIKNGNLESYIGFSANNFAFYNPVNGRLNPFMTVKNGQVFIRDGFIEDGSIDNAKIGNYIQSRNYVAGRAGWNIDKGGFAEFGNIKARGEINATSGSLRNVTIEEDCKIKGTLSVNNIVGDIVKVHTMNAGNLTIPPSPFDRVIVVPALQITASSSKQAWVSLNGNTICRARTHAISLGGLRTGYVPSIITGYGTLPKNVPGDVKYYQEGEGFMITILVFKA